MACGGILREVGVGNGGRLTHTVCARLRMWI